jgi:hypothetical protein
MSRGTHDVLPDERNESILIYVNGALTRRLRDLYEEAVIHATAGDTRE